MFPLIIADIPLNLKPEDAAYFRKTREARFGRKLEEITASRDKAVEGFRKSLDPLRLTLRTQPFLGGAALNYADYIVFGALMGVGGQPVQAADGRRSGLCLARAAARRVRWAGAEVAKLSRVGPPMPGSADTKFARAVITAAEPQLFVADIISSCDFFVKTLGFAIVFTYGEPPFYAQIMRDGARLNLRCVEQSVIDPVLRDREELLSASLTVASAEKSSNSSWSSRLQARRSFRRSGANHGAPAISSLGIPTVIFCCLRGLRRKCPMSAGAIAFD